MNHLGSVSMFWWRMYTSITTPSKRYSLKALGICNLREKRAWHSEVKRVMQSHSWNIIVICRNLNLVLKRIKLCINYVIYRTWNRQTHWLLRRVWRYQREVIRIRKSKKNRQHNGQKKKDKRTKHTHKTEDQVTRTSLKPGGELRCPERVSSFCSTSDRQ